MSRVDVERARAMRADGQTLKEIGEQFGVTRERIRQLVGSPLREKTCERCGTRFETGRAGHRFCSRTCAVAAQHGRNRNCECGSPMSATATSCWDCTQTAHENVRAERRRLIAELWREGLPVREIAAKVGAANANVVGVEMARMRNTGWDLPPRRAGWNGHSWPTGLPPLPPETPAQARAKFHHALLNGQIRRATRCERCGREGYVDGHHHDYSKPLYVEWLCRNCHTTHHAAARKASA
ncbi:MAG TPA: sigma factor-like helix-turn-helix DNA-binding protein [Solirubrobacteraceae bacterium]|nr:sigma factor-like helix-turn-helix DNA-binding protein [Solirubrobacteraceae bacterium]